MDNWIKLIEAVAKLIGSFAWPVAVIVGVVLLFRRHRAAVDRALDRVETLTLPGGMALTLRESLEDQQQQVLQAATRVAEAAPEQRDDAVADLIDRAQAQERMAYLFRVVTSDLLPRPERQAALEELNRLTPNTDMHVARGGRWHRVETVDDLDESGPPEPPTASS